TEGEPELTHLRKCWPKARQAEPALETIYGNSRLHALRIVNGRRQEAGLTLWRQPFVYNPLDDAGARRRHAPENLLTPRNSWCNNVLLVNDRLQGGGTWQDLVDDFGLSAQEIERIYSPLREAERPLVDAYAQGTISLPQLRRLTKYPRSMQAERLSD